jgi:hypothetical protein
MKYLRSIGETPLSAFTQLPRANRGRAAISGIV